MAPLPSGTGNSFAKELALPHRDLLGKCNLIRACDALSTGEVRSIDIDVCNENSHWLQCSGIGIDAYIVVRIEPRNRRTRRMGSVGYIALGLPALVDFLGIEAIVSIDAEMYEGRYVMVTISNIRRYAGGRIVLSPNSVLDDGYFEVCMSKGSTRSDVAGYLLELAQGTHICNPRITATRGRQIEVNTNNPSPVHHDGDPVGQTPLRCRLAPGALRLLVPSTAPIDLFQGQAEPFDG
ncbi:MAG TPA: hypothetical protein VMZ24_03710 [Patescibacteria group bacterium]|nr:hypothetical protein [Patescibacteria group bacterium]